MGGRSDSDSALLGSGSGAGGSSNNGNKASDGGVAEAPTALVKAAVAGNRVEKTCLVIIAGMMTAGALHWLEPVLVPLVLAVLLSHALVPVVDFLVTRAKLPHGTAVVGAMVVGVSVVAALMLMVSVSVKDLTRNAKEYEAYVLQVSQKLSMASDKFASSKLGSSIDFEQQMQEFPIGEFVTNTTRTILGSLVGFVSNSLLVVIFIIYLLDGRRKQKGPTRGIMGRVERRIQNYITIKLMVSVANGLLAAIVYYAFKLDMAMVFGLLHVLLNFIPSVGPIVATLLPLPVLVVVPSITFFSGTLCIGLPMLIHFAIGYTIEPTLLGEKLELHPITVLLCLIFWGMIWGIPGMLLATPITAALKILFESQETTTPFAHMLSGNFHALNNSSTRYSTAGGLARQDSDVEEGALGNKISSK